MLVFTGARILPETILPVPMPVALGVVGGLLALSGLALLLWPKREA
jgi:tellurite resistance protein TerC